VLELADINRRPFDQRGHFVEQSRGRVEAGVEFPGRRVELRRDRRPPLGKGGDDLARSQPGNILVRVADGDLAGRQEAVTHGRPAARQPEHLAGNDTVAMQEDQAMHRAHELVLGVAPAHHFWNRQLAQRLRDDLGQVRRELLALLFASGNEVLALAVSHLVQLCESHAGSAHEALEGFGRFAGCVERTGNRRALLFQHAVGLPVGNPGDRQREPPRRGVGRAHAVRSNELLRSEGGKNAVGEGFGEQVERFRWQLFTAQFDQDGIVHLSAPPWLRPPCTSENRAPGGNRGRPARLRAPGHAPGRCRRPARSPKWRRAHRAD
jgi:hypothetical protein